MFIGDDPINPTNIIGGCIGEYKNLWDLDKINQYINTVEGIVKDENSEIIFKKAVIMDELSGIENNTTNRTNYDLCLTEQAFKNKNLKDINNDFYLTLNSAVNNFQQIFGIEGSLFFVEPFNLLRYQGGQHYDAHYDGSTAERRSVSAIFYMNDNYEGGELEFVNYGIKIKPSAGSMYLFPSNWAYRHIAHPVTSGTKYAIVTWLHDRLQ
jgi:Rps23 Pro-64 3,4-dihydroxylase Tpa1-like proline 4-hydroxylase